MSKTQQSSTNFPFSGLAKRLQDNPAFMAWVLNVYSEQERLSSEELIEQLNTTPAMFTRLALCKRPDVESNIFTNQVRQISDYTEIDSMKLANLIRQVTSLETFKKLANATKPTKDVTEQIREPSWRGAFAAARDHEIQEEKTNGVPTEDNNQED